MSNKLSFAIFVTVVWSSSAFAVCEPERRAINDAEQQCEQSTGNAEDYNDCIKEKVRPLEEKYKQCIRDVNNGKRDR